MIISNDPRFAEGQWEPYRTSKDWRLQGFGLQTVYVRFRDAADNVAEITHDGILVHARTPVISFEERLVILAILLTTVVLVIFIIAKKHGTRARKREGVHAHG
jgi:hypothetical protein